MTRAHPSTVPALYAKLLDVDKVDIIVSGYATNMIAPAMPVAMQRNKVFPALFGTGVNSEFKYDRYFAMIPTGPNPKPAFTKPFFDVAMAQNPKPETISLAAADAEFGRNVCDGARENAKAAGLKIVYDKTYPPPTTDFAPIVRAIQATNPDIAVFCSYPLDSVGIDPRHQRDRLQGRRSSAGPWSASRPPPSSGSSARCSTASPTTRRGCRPRPWSILASTSSWRSTRRAPARRASIRSATTSAPGAMPTRSFSSRRIKGANSLEDEKLADYFRTATFKTIMGDVKFGDQGEWAESRFIAVQYHGIKGDELDQFKGMKVQTIVAPEAVRDRQADLSLREGEIG